MTKQGYGSICLFRTGGPTASLTARRSPNQLQLVLYCGNGYRTLNNMLPSVSSCGYSPWGCLMMTFPSELQPSQHWKELSSLLHERWFRGGRRRGKGKLSGLPAALDITFVAANDACSFGYVLINVETGKKSYTKITGSHLKGMNVFYYWIVLKKISATSETFWILHAVYKKWTKYCNLYYRAVMWNILVFILIFGSIYRKQERASLSQHFRESRASRYSLIAEVVRLVFLVFTCFKSDVKGCYKRMASLRKAVLLDLEPPWNPAAEGPAAASK